MIFYAERTRSAEFSDVIQGLYTPDCSVDSFKATLAAASKVGSSKSPSEYAQFISTVYKIEDATNIAQLGTVVGGLWATYKTAGVAAIKSSEGSITKLSSAHYPTQHKHRSQLLLLADHPRHQMRVQVLIPELLQLRWSH